MSDEDIGIRFNSKDIRKMIIEKEKLSGGKITG